MGIESITKKREFENKVSAFLRFMQTKTGIEIAEYATHLQETIDGLIASKEEFVVAYRDLLDKSWKADCSTCKNLEINFHNRPCSKCKHKERGDLYEAKSAIPGAAGNSPAEDGSPNNRMSAIDESNTIESSTASC